MSKQQNYYAKIRNLYKQNIKKERLTKKNRCGQKKRPYTLQLDIELKYTANDFMTF